MHALSPNAQIICDRLHYVRLVGENIVQARLDTCSTIDNQPLDKSTKRNLRLFCKCYPKLDDQKKWYDYHLNTHFTCKSYIDYLKEYDDRIVSLFIENYNIYQNLLKLIHEHHDDYKKKLNAWIDNIFKTKNIYFDKTARNFRKN